jgi:hypothetical protein
MANSVRRVKFEGFKDVSDWLEQKFGPAGDAKPEAIQALNEVINRTPHVVEPMPIYTIQEREDIYREFVNTTSQQEFSMGVLSSKFNDWVDPLTPGEVVMFVGDTGAGKTAVMQTIAQKAKPLPTLIFELELPLTKMFVREVQIMLACYSRDVKNDYKGTNTSYCNRYEDSKHVLICPESGIDMPEIERYITKSELKFGCHPAIVMVDYMGLVRKDLRNGRYEAIANAAEQAKVLAKRTNTIFFVGSQVTRPEHKKALKEIELHSAKGAGELESSCNLMIGVSRMAEDLIRMKVVKATSGKIGGVVDFEFDGPTLQLREKRSEQHQRARSD